MGLRELRERSALTRGELAALCGMSPVSLWRIEHGHVSPMARTRRKLSEALHVPVESVLWPTGQRGRDQ